MTDRREKTAPTEAELNVLLGRPDAVGTKVSGGMIENFREGWALNIIPHSTKPHYFKREPHFLFTKALCGFGGVVRWMYGEGDFKDERCRRCQKMLRRHG